MISYILAHVQDPYVGVGLLLNVLQTQLYTWVLKVELLLNLYSDGADVFLGDAFRHRGALDLYYLVELYDEGLLLLPILLPEDTEVSQLICLI